MPLSRPVARSLPRRAIRTVAVAGAAFAIAAIAACSQPADQKPPSADDALMDAAATKNLPAERYVSPTGGFDITLPGAWAGRYRVEERPDTTDGARLAVTFRFVPDSGSRAPSHVLLTVRIMPRTAWEAAAKRLGRPYGANIGERGDEVFVVLLPETNPYPASSAEAPVYDRLIISIAQGGQQIHVTTR